MVGGGEAASMLNIVPTWDLRSNGIKDFPSNPFCGNAMHYGVKPNHARTVSIEDRSDKAG